MRIALFTPVSPVKSGLVEHIEGLLPALAKRLDIMVITDGSYRPCHPLFREGNDPYIPWISYGEFEQRADAFDLAIYQLGNEANIHGYMFDALHRYPGLVFQHDLTLHHAIAGLTLDRGGLDAYRAEMRYCYGTDGDQLVRRVLAGQGDDVFNQYPLIDRVLDSSLGVVGFNEYMCSQIRALRPDLPVRYIPLHLYSPDGFPTDFDGPGFRRELGLSDSPVIATLGLFNPHNRLEIALRAFRRLLKRHPKAVYLLVGKPSKRQELLDKIGALGLTNNVRLTGWVSAEEFVNYMFVADIAVQLRYPHAGGTCYPPIRLLGLGVPTIISDIEPLAELPTDAVVRIEPDHPEEETLLFSAMDYLLTHRKVSRALGESGRRYALENHSLSVVVDRYVDFVQEIVTNREALEARVWERKQTLSPTLDFRAGLTHVAGRALAELGLASNNQFLFMSVAKAIHDLVPNTPQQKH